MDARDRLQARLRSLQGEFDRSFAQRRAPREQADEELLAIGVAGQSYALRLDDVGFLAAECALTPVPSESPALLGVAGLRGSLVAVYDLALLIGHSPAAAPRWFALAKGSSVAVAFEQFQGQLRVSREAVSRSGDGSGARGTELARSDGVCRTILDLPSIVAACDPRAPSRPREEQGEHA